MGHRQPNVGKEGAPIALGEVRIGEDPGELDELGFVKEDSRFGWEENPPR